MCNRYRAAGVRRANRDAAGGPNLVDGSSGFPLFCDALQLLLPRPCGLGTLQRVANVTLGRTKPIKLFSHFQGVVLLDPSHGELIIDTTNSCRCSHATC